MFLAVAVDGGFWPVWFGAILWWIPLAVYVLGGAWALWSLWRSEQGTVARVIWTLVVVLIPFFGVLAYTLAGHRSAGLGRRLAFGLGGLGIWLAVVVGSLLVGKVL